MPGIVKSPGRYDGFARSTHSRKYKSILPLSDPCFHHLLPAMMNSKKDTTPWHEPSEVGFRVSDDREVYARGMGQRRLLPMFSRVTATERLLGRLGKGWPRFDGEVSGLAGPAASGGRWAATSSLAPCPGAPSSSSTTTPPSYLHHVDLLAAVKLVVENCRSHRIAAVNYCYQGYFRQHAN